MNKIQYFAPFFKIYKRLKMIIIENSYPKLRIVKRSIGYIKNITITNTKWIQKSLIVHPPKNVLVNFNEFINKHIIYKT